MYVADLPWYDLPELTAATDAWWAGIGRHLGRLGVPGVPADLARADDIAATWADPRLLLGQACGYDVLYDARDVIVPIATPCYAGAGCSGPFYRSEVVVRADRPYRRLDDLRGARLSINEVASHSGNNALRPLVAPLSRDGRFFGAVETSGAHTDSLLALHQDRADVACVDAVVTALLRRVRPGLLDGLVTIAHTAPAVAPPHVTSRHTDAATRSRLQQALVAAAADPDLAACRRELLLERFELLPPAAYDALQDAERVAQAFGYDELPAPRRSPLFRPGQPGGGGACGGGARR